MAQERQVHSNSVLLLISVNSWLGPDILPALFALGAGICLLRQARGSPVWFGAGWGSIAFSLQASFWAFRRELGPGFPEFPATAVYLLGVLGWFITISRLEERSQPRHVLWLLPGLGLLLMAALAGLKQPMGGFKGWFDAGFAWFDVVLLFAFLPVLESGLRGQGLGKVLIGMGLVLRLMTSSMYYWLGLWPQGNAAELMLSLSYLLLGYGGYLEARGKNAGLGALVFSFASLAGLGLLLVVSLVVPKHPYSLYGVAGYAYFALIYAVGIIAALHIRLFQAERHSHRWVSLLEQLAAVGARPNQTLQPQSVLSDVMTALKTLFPHVTGLEIRSNETLKVGQKALYYTSFPIYIDDPAEVCIFMSRPPEEERGLEVLTPLLADKLRQALSLFEWRSKALTDPLTGLANRRGLERRLLRLLELAQTDRKPISVAMIDLDYFKRVNDTFDHSTGDKTLQAFAALLQHYLRSDDLAVRWGGEEFALLLVGAKLDEARQVVERIRSELSASEIEPITWKLTTSAGLSGGMVPTDKSTLQAWLLQADWALLQAKEQGRDRVVVAEPHLSRFTRYSTDS